MKTSVRRTIAVAAALGTVAATAAVAPAVAAPAEELAAPAMLAPYYTNLDLTGDRQVDAADLLLASAALGLTSSEEGWDIVAAIDTDGDEVITITDIAGLSQRMIYDDGPFELVEASVLDMQAAMNAGVTTSVEITQDYIDRIAAYDDVVIEEGGQAINSILTVSASALEAAAAADASRAANGMTSMLLGVPIALKDNYDTFDMTTTAGCGCWDANQTATDAFMVEGLRADGAVILAKASLDEFATGFSSQYSSFQDGGPMVRVQSPYNTSRTAGGSSGGTGGSIAANLAGIGFGTDTGGSIRVPSSYNQLVGVRPTVGLASRDGIVPLALSQDTGGPMARSVVDAAVALDAVVGIDENDAVTSRQAGLVPDSYTSYLDAEALESARIGFFSSMFSTNNATVQRSWAAAQATIAAQGGTVVSIAQPSWLSPLLNESSGSNNEFRHDLQIYIDNHLNAAVDARSVADIIASDATGYPGTYERRVNVTEGDYANWIERHGTVLAQGKIDITALLDEYDLDAIVYPSASTYGTLGTNLRLSPNTGLPAVTVPMGVAVPSDNTVANAGVNLEFLGRDFAEGPLLGLAYAFEQATQARTTPTLYPALTD